MEKDDQVPKSHDEECPLWFLRCSLFPITTPVLMKDLDTMGNFYEFMPGSGKQS